MEQRLVTMSSTELTRAAFMQRIAERRTTQAEATRQLGMSLRQVERMYAAYKREGPAALASKRRGKISNRKLADAYRQSVIQIVRECYADFGPTLAREKLLERHGSAPSIETLRKWMSDEGLWRTRSERRKRAQPPRHRRECLGELIQIDGCDHDWFEDRGPRCTLLVFVDDATSRLMELRFARSESTFDYFAATERYLRRHGKPVAFYSDKAAIFRVNAKEAVAGAGYTQFGRAMQELNIDVICPNTPAAKGRVERAHQTLQDRLVKELRLCGISERDAGNVFLDQFRDDYNHRFARVPKNPHDAHRPMLPHEDLSHVFTMHERRRLTDNLALHYNRVLYVIHPTEAAKKARGKSVDIRETNDGSVHIEYRGVELLATAFPKDAQVNPGAIVENKRLSHVLQVIATAQRERTENKLHAKGVTLRRKDQLRKALGVTGEFTPQRRNGHVRRPTHVCSRSRHRRIEIRLTMY